MPGASQQTRRVKILNANWVPDAVGGDGQFTVLLITEDDPQFAVPISPASMTALVALAQANTVMAWDPENGGDAHHGQHSWDDALDSDRRRMSLRQ